MERLEPSRRKVVFHSASGPLTVIRTDTAYSMDFPTRLSQSTGGSAGIGRGAGRHSRRGCGQRVQLRGRAGKCDGGSTSFPDIAAIARIDRGGVIVTAPGDGPYDFVSRYFAPAKGIPEDPVTGSAHCALAPYWAGRLHKTAFFAFQASRRGGEIRCKWAGDRVELEGSCVFYMEGEAQV